MSLDIIKEESDRDVLLQDWTRFTYSSAILKYGQTDTLKYSPTCWPMPNRLVRAVIWKDINPNKLSLDRVRELLDQKYRLQRRFVNEHDGETALCEALDLHDCMENKCPFFKEGLCMEFKIVFKRLPEEPRRTNLPRIA